MAIIATNLVDYSDNGNVRTYAAPGHTVNLTRLVQQRRKIPSTPQASAESSIRVVYGTSDANNVPLAAKYSFDVVGKGPVNGNASDQAAALALLREIVNSDEFAAAIASQLWIKG